MPAVHEIMTRDVLAVESTTRLPEAAARMHERGVGAVVVVESGRLVGIFTERDVLRAVATGTADGPVGDTMTRAPETIGQDEATSQAAALMIHGGFRHLPVVAGDDVVGMISIRDLIRVSIDDEAPRGA
jgi:CBS domain-containing protein